MYADGETELRDLIIQNLETSGFLNKIKAELRAGVFIAFEEEGSLRTKNPLFNKKFDEFIDTSNGKLVVSLVREFLEYFNLNFTLSVFDPETSTSPPCLNRTDLCDKLNLQSSELNGPVLSALLKTGKDIKQTSNGTNSFAPSSSSNSKKSLETITEDIAITKENSKAKTPGLSTTFDVGNNSLVTSLSNEDSIKSVDTGNKKSMIDKLRNEHHSLELSKKENNIFGTSKSDDIFKVNSSDDLGAFFDEPLLSPPKASPFGEISSSKPGEIKSSFLADSKPAEGKSSFLPAIDKDWSFAREAENKQPSFFPDLESSKQLPGALSKLDASNTSGEKQVADSEAEKKKKEDLDPESNEEELSDRQESIEEEIEEDFSGGLDDLLNSSLSLADDATTDQSASQISVVGGVDHLEPVTN